MDEKKSDGIYSFDITESNARKLRSLLKYAEMVDEVIEKDPSDTGERLNADGVINELLDEITDKRISDLRKRHCFESSDEFIDLVGSCKDGEDVKMVIESAEMAYYKKYHTNILSQIPAEDRQGKLDFGD
jgi:hypothetical protein